MTLNKKVLWLLLTLAAIVLVPYWAAYLGPSKRVPSDTFNFPPIAPGSKLGFSWVHCIGIVLIFLGVLVLFLYPRIYGFKKLDATTKPRSKHIPLPLWFWIGLVLWGGSLVALTLRWSEPKWLLNWAMLPLFWGFTLMLDGWVYVRNDRRSYVSVDSRELIAIGIVSISGWLIFEYLNYFIRFNWYYPKAKLIPHDDFLLYATLGSSGLMPMAFEWYHLLKTFPFFKNKYRRGPMTRFSNTTKTVLLILCFIGLAAAAYYPNNVFFILWLAPLIILTVVLEWLGIWTPFIAVQQGNWSPLILFSITYLVQGFLLEWWNYLSGDHMNGKVTLTYNPGYWAYSIPFVDRWHVFEMPILGYLGYIPFGVYCWIWWITTSFILNISKDYTISMEKHDP